MRKKKKMADVTQRSAYYVFITIVATIIILKFNENCCNNFAIMRCYFAKGIFLGRIDETD